jgi:hypothetical protein
VSDDPEELSALRNEIDQVERDAARRIDPGAGALLIAVAVLALLIAELLPWVGPVTGARLLLGQIPDGVKVGVVPKVFAFAVVIAGVLGSALGLLVRRWAVAWLLSLGLFVAAVSGVLSIWTQQTTTSHAPGPGPGSGLVVAVIAVIVLLVKWLRLAASRPGM